MMEILRAYIFTRIPKEVCVEVDLKSPPSVLAMEVEMKKACRFRSDRVLNAG